MIRFNIENFTEETLLKSNGVYMITHPDTNLKYVGSTFTKRGFVGRWLAHLNCIRRNIGNPILCNIAAKYGIDKFKFHILEVTDNYNTTRARERYWIDYYDTFKNGANLTDDTFTPKRDHRKHPYTEQEKIKYLKTSTTKKTVYVYSLQGELLYTFESSVQCDKFFGVKKGTTSYTICSNKHHSIKGIYFPSYEKKTNWVPIEEKQQRMLKRAKLIATNRKNNGTYKMNDVNKQKIRLANKKRLSVSLFTQDGKFFKSFDSLNACDDFLKLTRGATSKVLKGKAKTLKRIYIPKLI